MAPRNSNIVLLLVIATNSLLLYFEHDEIRSSTGAFYPPLGTGYLGPLCLRRNRLMTVGCFGDLPTIYVRAARAPSSTGLTIQGHVVHKHGE